MFSREVLRRAIKNSGWLLAGQGSVLIINTVVTLLIARYLGPSHFGQLSYVLAGVALLTPISQLGLNSIVTRDLVAFPDKHYSILGTSLTLRIVGGSMALIVGLCLVVLIRPEEQSLHFYFLILLLSEIFKSAAVFNFWLESDERAKAISSYQIVVAILSALLKLYLISIGAGLTAVVFAYALDGLLFALALIYVYRKSGYFLNQLRFSGRLAIGLLKRCLPLIASGVTAVIYLKIDQIMIGQILNDKAVGLYAAASRISEVWFFVPSIVVISIFPALIRQKEEDAGLYEAQLQQAFDFLFWFGILCAASISILSDELVRFLFGSEFSGASPVLAVHVWAGVFICIRALISKWLLIEDLIAYSLISQLLGAVSNIALNFLFIPRYGIMGAAVSTIISYSIAAYFVFAAFGKTRSVTRKVTLAVLAPVRLIVLSLRQAR